MKLRLSVVNYLNTLPLVWGVLHGEEREFFELSFAVPAQCADSLRTGDVDIGIIPVIEYQRIPDLMVVPDVSIASKRCVRSVILASRVPLDEIRRVAVDESSRTSVVLLRLLFQHQAKIQPEFTMQAPELARMLEENEAALLIGDPAMKIDRRGLFVYDLAEWWHQMTSLPFVFAFWAIRKEKASQVAAVVFRRSKDYGLAHLREIAREQSPLLGLSEEAILKYFQSNIDYSLDEENLRGLNLFFKLAAQSGLIETARELQFLKRGSVPSSEGKQ